MRETLARNSRDMGFSIEIEKLVNPATEANLLQGLNETCCAVCFDEEHVHVLIREKKCARGQLVEIDLRLIEPKKQDTLCGMAKIIDTIRRGNGFEEVILELKSINNQSWQSFFSHMEERQENAENLLEKIRGL